MTNNDDAMLHHAESMPRDDERDVNILSFGNINLSEYDLSEYGLNEERMNEIDVQELGVKHFKADYVKKKKQKLNAYATAFSQTRKAWTDWEEIPKERQIERMMADPNAEKAIVAVFGLIRDMGNLGSMYINVYLADLDWHPVLINCLLKYDSDIALFTTYFEKTLRLRAIRPVGKRLREIAELIADRERPNGGEGLIAAVPDERQNMEYGVLYTWGGFAKSIADLQHAAQGMNGTSVERYPVYATRDYLLEACYAHGESVSLIREEVDEILRQPYIAYLSKKAAKNETEAVAYIEHHEWWKRNAVDLMHMYRQNKLLPERYETQNTFNVYFQRTNLNEDFNHYRTLHQAYFMDHLPHTTVNE